MSGTKITGSMGCSLHSLPCRSTSVSHWLSRPPMGLTRPPAVGLQLLPQGSGDRRPRGGDQDRVVGRAGGPTGRPVADLGQHSVVPRAVQVGTRLGTEFRVPLHRHDRSAQLGHAPRPGIHSPFPPPGPGLRPSRRWAGPFASSGRPRTAGRWSGRGSGAGPGRRRRRPSPRTGAAARGAWHPGPPGREPPAARAARAPSATAPWRSDRSGRRRTTGRPEDHATEPTASLAHATSFPDSAPNPVRSGNRALPPRRLRGSGRLWFLESRGRRGHG